MTRLKAERNSDQHDEDFGSGKILEVPVVGDDVNRYTGTLKIVSPMCEGFNDCE